MEKKKKGVRLWADRWKEGDEAWKLRGIGNVSREKQQEYLDKLYALFETRNSYKSDIDFEDKFLDLWIHVYKHSGLEEIQIRKQAWASMPPDSPYVSSPSAQQTVLRSLDSHTFFHLDFCNKLIRAKPGYISKLRKRMEDELQQQEASGSCNEDQTLQDDETWVIIPSTTNL